jgi:uncharacterized membrane protein YfcA
MLADTVLTAPLSIVVAVAGCLIVAGMLKGIIGVGMPIIALPLVTMFLDAPAAVMLLSMPLVLSNIPQALEGGEAAQCLLRLAPVLIGMLPGTLAGVAMLLVVKASVAKLLTGCIVVMVGSLTLFGRNFVLPSKSHTPMGLLSGFSGGVLGGLAAMPGPLVFTFLLAKGLRGKTFTKEASMFLVLSALLLAATLTCSQRFDVRDLAISVGAVAPIAMGMVIGQRLRDNVPALMFRRLVLIVVLVSGLELIRKSLWS